MPTIAQIVQIPYAQLTWAGFGSEKSYQILEGSHVLVGDLQHLSHLSELLACSAILKDVRRGGQVWRDSLDPGIFLRIRHHHPGKR